MTTSELKARRSRMIAIATVASAMWLACPARGQNAAPSPHRPPPRAAADNAVALSPSWTMACAPIDADNACGEGCNRELLAKLAPGRFACLEDAGLLHAFDRKSFPTFEISIEDGPPWRAQRMDRLDAVNATPGAAGDSGAAGHRPSVVAEVGRESICFAQASNSALCGPLAATIAPDTCSKLTEDRWTTCKVRPIPWDNPDFPNFPDPHGPHYFAPWHPQTLPGEVPGDVDKVFFHGVGRLQQQAGGQAADAGAPMLTPAQRRALDLLAWQDFLAINWPANQDGANRRDQIDRSLREVTHYCPTWAGWRRVGEVMRPQDQLPLPWGLNPTTDGKGWVCSAAFDRDPVAMLSATGGRLGVSFGNLHRRALQPDGNVLWDANGSFVVYDTRMNEVLYGDILEKNLFHGDTPRSHLGFEHGTFYRNGRLGLERAETFRQGPVAIKLALRMLTRGEVAEIRNGAARFILAQAPVLALSAEQAFALLRDNRRTACDDADTVTTERRRSDRPTTLELEDFSEGERPVLLHLARAGLLALPDVATPAPPGEEGAMVWGERSLGRLKEAASDVEPDSDQWRALPDCDDQTGCKLGVVAMHIGHKTGTNEQWNWSTFMHREALAEGAGMFQGRDCPQGPIAACNACDEDGTCRTSICRPPAVAPGTRQLNDQVRGLLQGSNFRLLQALAHYDLLGMQWVDSERVKPTASMPEPGYRYARDPEVLLNPLMETFLDPATDAADDCHSCHLRAGWRVKDEQGRSRRIRSELMFFLTHQPQAE